MAASPADAADVAEQVLKQAKEKGYEDSVWEVAGTTCCLEDAARRVSADDYIQSFFQATAGVQFRFCRADIVHNPNLMQTSSGYWEFLEKRRVRGNIFNPKYPGDRAKDALVRRLRSLFRTAELTGRAGTRTNVLLAWHGPSSPEVAHGIADHGFAALSSTEPGDYGHGRYMTPEAEYACLYASEYPTDRPPNGNGEWPVLLCACIVGLAYPVTPCKEDFAGELPPTDAQQCRFMGKPLQSSYDTHVVGVAGNNFLAVHPDDAQFHELVFSQDAQLLPLAIVWFRRQPAGLALPGGPLSRECAPCDLATASTTPGHPRRSVLRPCAATQIWSEDNLVRLDIPAGGAPESAVRSITIRLVTSHVLLRQLRDTLPGDARSAIYALEPHGQRFEKAVTLRIGVAELAGPEVCCPSHVSARPAGSHTHSTAMLKRSFGGPEWNSLATWVDEDGNVAASMHCFCFVVLSCCKPLVSVAERLVGDRLRILLSWHTEKLSREDYERQERNGYRWTDTDMTEWRQVFSHGSAYKLQACVGSELLPQKDIWWNHFRGFENLPISISLQALRGSGSSLRITCDGIEQMELELVSLSAVPLQLGTGSEDQTLEALAPTNLSCGHRRDDIREDCQICQRHFQGMEAGAAAREPEPTDPQRTQAAQGAAVIAQPPLKAAKEAIEPLGALAIGNQSYGNALTGAIPDATRMYDFLRELGFKDRCDLLQNVGAAVLRACCAEFVARLNQQLSDSTQEHGETGVAIFYFAGHGVEVNGKYQMLPVPVAGTDDLPAAGTGDVLASCTVGVCVEEALLKPLEKVKLAQGRKALCILLFDTCRKVDPSSASSSSVVAPQVACNGLPGRPHVSQRSKEKYRQVTDRCLVDCIVVWACAPGGVVKDASSYIGGQLTKALVEHLGHDESLWKILQRVGDVVRQSTMHTQSPCASMTLGEAWSLRPRDLRAGGDCYKAHAGWCHFENQARRRISGHPALPAGAAGAEAAVAPAVAAT